jgi:hypothetical protein
LRSSWHKSPSKPGAQVHANASAAMMGMHGPIVMNPAGAATWSPEAVMLRNCRPTGDTPSESSAKNMYPVSSGREMVHDAPTPSCQIRVALSGPRHSQEPAEQTLLHVPVGMDCSGPHASAASSHTQAVAPSMHTISSVVSDHHVDSGVPLSVESRHTAALLHGYVSHSSTSMEHVRPVKPSEHEHTKPSTMSAHTPFTHGASAQSSVFVSQVAPSNPGAHEHMNSP